MNVDVSTPRRKNDQQSTLGENRGRPRVSGDSTPRKHRVECRIVECRSPGRSVPDSRVGTDGCQYVDIDTDVNIDIDIYVDIVDIYRYDIDIY